MLAYEKCKSRPIGNKASKTQPIGDEDKKIVWNVEFYILNVHCHLLSTFMMEVAISNGFDIKHSFGNFHDDLIFFKSRLMSRPIQC